MNRYALLFGNTNGLKGVQKDLYNFKKFLMSDVGGAWYEKEIFVKENVSKSWLLENIEILRKAKLDYLIIYFSGHGGSIRNEDFIELNKDGERIKFTKLEKIATRQLNIYDCCRASVDDELVKSSENFSRIDESVDNLNVRKIYERRILQAAPQQMSLYSCSEGEYSQDTSEGGLYTFNFIKSARKLINTEKTVIQAHSEAEKFVNLSNSAQTPDYKMEKLQPYKQLIISINPLLNY